MGFSAGGGFGRLRQENVYSGLSRGTNFYQEPDITLTLWMLDRWFIETTFLEGFDRNTYRAGYVGRSDEFVREVIIGNSGISADSFAEIDVPSPLYNTPGLAAKFGTAGSDHQLLIRFDPTDTQERYFQGQYEVNTQDIGLPDFIRGRYFILPDTAVTAVQVFLEDRSGSITGTDANGTVRKYRRAEEAEFFVENSSGLVELASAHDGQVLVYYTSGAGPVGAVGGGQNFIVPADANFHPDFEAWGGIQTNLLDFGFSVLDEYDPEGRTYNATSRCLFPWVRPSSFTSRDSSPPSNGRMSISPIVRCRRKAGASFLSSGTGVPSIRHQFLITALFRTRWRRRFPFMQTSIAICGIRPTATPSRRRILKFMVPAERLIRTSFPGICCWRSGKTTPDIIWGQE